MRDRIVKQYDNGLKLIYKRNTSKEAAYFEFRFFSGLNNDPKDKLGLAHFVEHSAGFSNNKYTRQEKSDYRIKLYYANFSTGRNSMRFYAYVSDEEFEEVFSHYVNSITDFTIPQEEFDNEKKVINQEILRFRKNLSNEMSYTIRETFYNEVNDIRIRPFGTIETVENITKQDLEDYIKKCFVLENCQLTIYGNIPYYKVKKLIKKIVFPAFSKSSGTKFLKPNQTILYTKNAPLMVVNPSPDEGKSQVRILHKIDLSNIDRYRGYAVSLLNSIYETATHEYFRAKFGLCYASSMRFYKSVSINNDYDILEMNIVIDCDQAVVKTVLEKVPEFYDYLKEYPINEDSVEKTNLALKYSCVAVS